MSPTISQVLVQVQGVSLVEGKREILQHINLSLLPGQIVSIIGPNGAGKTSLIKVIVGLVPPTKGCVIRKPALRIGYMPQRLHIEHFLPLTVERFLQLGLDLPRTQLHAMLEEVGIQQVWKSPLQSISGGEFQRVLLARALLRQPELLVLDEPAQGIDLLGQGELYDLIAQIRSRFGCGILLVSHDLSVVMAQTDIVVCLNQHVCCSGQPEEVRGDPAFMSLFGKAAQGLAFYTHHHDHHHHVGGAVSNKDTPDDS